MRIVGIFAQDYPWDVRVEKILGGLARGGHEIHLICKNVSRRPLVEPVDGVVCHRVLPPQVPASLQALIGMPAFFNPFWTHALRSLIRDYNPHLVIVRDLPLALMAVRVAAANGIPCLVDMAENHPEMWREVCRNDPLRLPSMIAKNPSVAEMLERRVAAEADHIFVVVEEMKEHLVAIGADSDQISVVSNTPEDIPEYPTNVRPEPHESLNIVFTGFITNRRGLDQVIRALCLLDDLHPSPRLHLAGTGPHVRNLQRLANRLGVAKHLAWHGWLDHSMLGALITQCDIGVVPHPKNGHTDHTIPNKIFDYMAYCRPVLVSNARPMVRVVEETGCGLVFEDGCVEHLAAQLRRLACPKLREELGANGRRAVIERFNWARDMATVEAIVKKMTS